MLEKTYRGQVTGLIEGDASTPKIETTTVTLDPEATTQINIEYFDETGNERSSEMFNTKNADDKGTSALHRRRRIDAQRFRININTDATV